MYDVRYSKYEFHPDNSFWGKLPQTNQPIWGLHLAENHSKMRKWRQRRYVGLLNPIYVMYTKDPIHPAGSFRENFLQPRSSTHRSTHTKLDEGENTVTCSTIIIIIFLCEIHIFHIKHPYYIKYRMPIKSRYTKNTENHRNIWTYMRR